MPSIFFTLAAQASAAATALCGVQNINAPTMEHLIFGPTRDVAVPSHPKEGRDPAELEKRSNLEIANSGKALGYTRIRAAFIPCHESQRAYSSERRGPIKRYLFGKNADKLLMIGVKLKPGDVRLEHPIASVTRHSTKQGENWSTSIHNDRILTPYFRADLGSTLTLDASLKSTRDYDATVGGDVLKLIEEASALISPTTQLITEANKDRFTKAATFVDSAVDGLLKVAIEEKALSDLQLYPGKDGAVLALLTVNLPMANNTFQNANFPNRSYGKWIIYAEGLRQSMLGNVVGGEVMISSTSPAAVLNYLIADKKTLRGALSEVKSVTTARDGLVGSKDGFADKARALCRAVEAEAEALGLSQADVGAAMWAYLHDLALEAKKMKAAEPGCSELANYPG